MGCKWDLEKNWGRLGQEKDGEEILALILGSVAVPMQSSCHSKTRSGERILHILAVLGVLSHAGSSQPRWMHVALSAGWGRLAAPVQPVWPIRALLWFFQSTYRLHAGPPLFLSAAEILCFPSPLQKKRCENIKFQEPEMVLVDVEKKYRNYFLQDVVMRKMEKAFSKVPQGEKVLFLPQIHLLGMGFLLGSFHLGWDFPSSSVRVPLPALCFQAVQPYGPLGKAASLCSPRAFSLLPCPGFSFIVAAA